jgi:dimethylglycine dehydrogenase
VKENYQRRFAISYPNEELPAARPMVTTPAYGAWKSRNAVFGSGFGLEHVNYFAPAGEEPFETPTFRRSNAFATVGEECRAVRTAVGINEIHNFGKYEITGTDAASWLGYVMAGRVPAPGRMTLTPMLSPRGRLIGDFTITCLGEERYQLTASYAAQSFHMRWFEEHLPKSGVTLRNMSLRRIGFQIAGPKARELLSRVTTGDVSNSALPFLSARELDVGLVPAIVCRVTYTGDLGYEIYVAPRYQLALYDALQEAGQDLGLRPFGMRAMMSLRLEKSFGAWLREYRPDYSAAETGLARFIHFARNDFIGRDAAMAERDNPPERTLCTFVVEADDADVWADEPIWNDDEVVGFVTSGGYAHFVEKSVALGLIPKAIANQDAAFEIEILGSRRPARLITEALLDPPGARMRG